MRDSFPRRDYIDLAVIERQADDLQVVEIVALSFEELERLTSVPLAH